MSRWGMVIDLDRCTACQACTIACRAENNIPFAEPPEAEKGRVISWNQVMPSVEGEYPRVSMRYIPMPCMHCDHPPCVQVCPVGATFVSPDGVVLVDKDYCVGCRYCIQACPYGARYLHPTQKVADKCTFCYHRIRKGLIPACVEVCPTKARIFGEVGQRSSPVHRFLRFNDVTVLKSWLNTKPKVYYAGADGEVR